MTDILISPYHLVLTPNWHSFLPTATDKLIFWGYTFGLDARDYTIRWELVLERRSPEYFYSLVELHLFRKININLIFNSKPPKVSQRLTKQVYTTWYRVYAFFCFKTILLVHCTLMSNSSKMDFGRSLDLWPKDTNHIHPHKFGDKWNEIILYCMKQIARLGLA